MARGPSISLKKVVPETRKIWGLPCISSLQSVDGSETVYDLFIVGEISTVDGLLLSTDEGRIVIFNVCVVHFICQPSQIYSLPLNFLYCTPHLPCLVCFLEYPGK